MCVCVIYIKHFTFMERPPISLYIVASIIIFEILMIYEVYILYIYYYTNITVNTTFIRWSSRRKQNYSTNTTFENKMTDDCFRISSKS